jgi:hypothetical protein
MALNDIRLNSTLLAEIYKDFLVEIEDQSFVNLVQSSKSQTQIPEDISTTKTSSIGLKHLGEFKKRILLVVRYPGIVYLPDEPLNFLTSILNACKLSLADVAIVNIANLPSIQYNDLREKYNRAVIVVLFGPTPSELEMPVNFPEFQIQPFNNCTFLYAPVLEKLEADNVLKSKLWVCLRRIFDLP